MISPAFMALVTVLAAYASIASAHDPVTCLASRRLTEYQLPGARETHEFARVPGTNLIVLSQMSDSVLLKIELDSVTEAPIALRSFPMGSSNESALHGVWPSTRYPGLVWLTLQNDNKLLLVDPGVTLEDAPAIIKTISIPAPGNGPHCVCEIGCRVWATLKLPSPQTGGFYVFSAPVDGDDDTSDFKLYPCLDSPVFVREDESSKFIYVTQDTSSSIMRIDTKTGETAQLPIPPSVGNTPVGMTTVSGRGPLGGLWFTLAGNATGGAGSFGRVTRNGTLQFFNLKTPQPGSNAGLLHVADATTKAGGPALWLLSTTLLSNQSADALIRVTFDANVTSTADEEYIAMLTPGSMVHRVVPMDSTVLVSELHTFTLAQLTYNNTVAGQWLPAEVASNKSMYTG